MVFFTKTLLGLLAITMNGINYLRNQSQNVSRPCDNNEFLISLFPTRRPFLFNTRLNAFRPLTTTKNSTTSNFYDSLIATTEMSQKIPENKEILNGTANSDGYHEFNSSDFEINFRLTPKDKKKYELIGDPSSTVYPRFQGKLSKETQTVYLENVEIDLRKTSFGSLFGDLPQLINLTLLNVKLLRKSKESYHHRFQILKGQQITSLFPKLKSFTFTHIEDPDFLTALKSSPNALQEILFFGKKIGEFSFENVWDLNVNMRISVGKEKIFQVEHESYEILSSLNYTNDLLKEFQSTKRIEYNRKTLYKKEYCYLQDCGNGNHIKRIELSALSRISSLRTCCILPKKFSFKEFPIVPSLIPQETTSLNFQKVSLSTKDLGLILKRSSRLKDLHISSNEGLRDKLEIDISNLQTQMKSLSLENMKIINSVKSKISLDYLTLVNIDYPINFETEIFDFHLVPKNFAFSSSNFSESIELFLRSAVQGNSLRWIHFQNFYTQQVNAINFLDSTGIILNDQPNSFSLKMDQNKLWHGKSTYNLENSILYHSLTGKYPFVNNINNDYRNNIKSGVKNLTNINSKEILIKWKNLIKQNGLKSLQFNNDFDLTSIERYKNKETIGLIHMKGNEAFASTFPHLFLNFTKLEYIFIEDLTLFGEFANKAILKSNLKGFHYHEKFMRGNSENEMRDYLTKSRLDSIMFFVDSPMEDEGESWDDQLWNLGIDVKISFGNFTALDVDHEIKKGIISNYHESFNIKSRDDLNN